MTSLFKWMAFRFPESQVICKTHTSHRELPQARPVALKSQHLEKLEINQSLKPLEMSILEIIKHPSNTDGFWSKKNNIEPPPQFLYSLSVKEGNLVLYSIAVCSKEGFKLRWSSLVGKFGKNIE